MSKRQNFYDYYTTPRYLRNSTSLLEKSASAATTSPFTFNGERIAYTVVVRSDLNGYSKWTKENHVSIADRAALLDDFFTSVVGLMPSCQGIYFRDEGDCIITIFSPYFYSNVTFKDVEKFCQSIVGRKYGKDELTAKCCVAGGDVAYYQKSHEIKSGDWSAEGDPFIHSHRLESTVESKPRIYFYNELFKERIKPEVTWATPGTPTKWTVYEDESYQIPGMGQAGGWSDVSYYECNSF